jgi:hypothetical protein
LGFACREQLNKSNFRVTASATVSSETFLGTADRQLFLGIRILHAIPTVRPHRRSLSLRWQFFEQVQRLHAKRTVTGVPVFFRKKPAVPFCQFTSSLFKLAMFS